MYRVPVLLPLLLICLLGIHARGDKPAPVSVAPHVPVIWEAGLASIVVTPEKYLWMAGYAGHDKPAEG